MPTLEPLRNGRSMPGMMLPNKPAEDTPAQQLAVLERRLEREREARKQAEALLTDKSRELFVSAERAREAEHTLALALWASGDSVWEWKACDQRVTIRSFDEDRLHIRGDAPQILLDDADRVHPADTVLASAQWRDYLRGATRELETSFRVRLQEQWRWIRIRGRAVERLPGGRIERIVGTLRDISQEVEAKQALDLLSDAFDKAREPMLMLDRRGLLHECNRAFHDLVGIHEFGSGSHLFSLLLGERKALEALLADVGEGWREELQMKRGDGSLLPIELSIQRVIELGDRRSMLVATVSDLSLQRSAQARAQRASLTDGLTGLANRAHFENRLRLRMAREDSAPLALLWINLDGFRAINDSLGHAAGDAFLFETAQRLQDIVGERDELGRLSGDEFALLVDGEDIGGRTATLSRQIIETVGAPMQMGERMVSVSASIGVALFPEDSRQPDELLQQAETAMRKAKQRGRARTEYHRGAISGEAARRLELITELRRDIEAGAMDTVLQPKVSAGGYVVGYELLMRWNNPRLGAVSPAAFIPLSEEFGLVGQLGLIAMERAAEFASRLLRMGLHTPVALNLSPRQVFDPDTEEQLVAACARLGLPHDMLEIELTESALLENIEAGRGFLRRLSEQGFKLALDDFGTGFSSLAYLRRLPFNTIKIDRCFMDDIDTDARALRLLEGMVTLCRSLDIAVVAEGVETQAQRNLLVRMGVDQMQGYHFARPMPAEDVLLLATRRLPATR
jgi:diguanylate cyclase (GGDEF)-like protein